MTDDPIREFDVISEPLSGQHLVEASAGTGKTRTIAGLYSRLIVESGLSVDRILVVTYTKAATAELKDRIRKRLKGLLTSFETCTALDDFDRQMLLRFQGPRDLATTRLARAVSGFDQAAVFTIHGYCQRLLEECAFESGSGFNYEILPDTSELLREIVEDFWRVEAYGADPAWAAFLAENGESPRRWQSEIAPHVEQPFLRVLEPVLAKEPGRMQERLQATIAEALQVWIAERSEIEALLHGFGGFNANKIRPDRLARWLEAINGFLGSVQDHGFSRSPAQTLAMFPREAFAKLAANSLEAAVKKGQVAPRHAFFDLCREIDGLDGNLRKLYGDRAKAIRPRLLKHVNEELAKRKQHGRVWSYNDLLNNVAAALETGSGQALASAAVTRFPAALIDEFQDTDPTQYRIFSRIYGEPGATLFFVGDPKQAIYGFRGADVFSYLAARGAAGLATSTLATNYRSEPALVAAVNQLFLSQPEPFVLAAIPFRPVKAAASERPRLAIGGDDGQPMRFLVLPALSDPARNAGLTDCMEWSQTVPGRPYGKSQATEASVSAVATEVARLLRLASLGQARLGPRPVSENDIAVLVSTHAQARQVQDALSARGVQSVRQSQDNVFAGPEALELERVLLAVAEPNKASRLNAALATTAMDYSATALTRLAADDGEWERIVERFRGYRERWLHDGFAQMFRRWFGEFHVARNLAQHPDPERALTNWMHLADLLQAESRHRPGIDPLLAWFSRTLRQPAPFDEEVQLRLESDGYRVKIVTVHASKGLEYPIVFCPFLWDGKLSQRQATATLFHQGGRATVDFGSAEQDSWRRQAILEELAEKSRLLYVALTRAIYRCYIVWGNVRNASDPEEGLHSSALAWLLHGSPSKSDEDPMAALAARLEAMGQAGIETDLQAFSDRSKGNVHIAPATVDRQSCRPAAEQAEADLRPRKFARPPLRACWRISSFTGIAIGRQSETPDYDATTDIDVDPSPDGSIFAFPRGARAGSCLHAILEEWDFTSTDRDRFELLTARKLRAHGLDTSWTKTVSECIVSTLDRPLSGTGLRLRDIPSSRRLSELEFTFALAGENAQSLHSVLADPRFKCHPLFIEASFRLDPVFVAGYMRGYIDLVFEDRGKFYLADYKSNWLGGRASDYTKDRLAETMAREHYYLQYLIYALALHRYLQLRLPNYDYERHFGGIYYLFLRGMASSAAAGIFSDRPSAGLIRRLDELVS